MASPFTKSLYHVLQSPTPSDPYLPLPSQSFNLSLTHCVLATWDSLPFLKQMKNAPASGSLHLLVSSQPVNICVVLSLTSFRFLLRFYLLKEAFLDYPI